MVAISRSKEEMLSFDEAKRIFRYEPETGKLFWRVNRWRRIKPGDEAATIATTTGYKIVRVGATYLQHRLVWLLYYGEWPKGLVDHINLDKLDNRIFNLRTVNYSQSNANRRGSSRKKVGSLKGASFLQGKRVWRSSIKMDGKTKNLGNYRTELEAHLVFCAAAKLCHGPFARTGP
jgi:Demerecviridae HNH endonuclease